jgi:hypothetical protein
LPKTSPLRIWPLQKAEQAYAIKTEILQDGSLSHTEIVAVAHVFSPESVDDSCRCASENVGFPVVQPISGEFPVFKTQVSQPGTDCSNGEASVAPASI